MGRFVSADPIQDCGLGTQGWNRYGYVGNRTVSLFDPSGFISDAGRVLFTIGGGGSYHSYDYYDLWPYHLREVWEAAPDPSESECPSLPQNCQQLPLTQTIPREGEGFSWERRTVSSVSQLRFRIIGNDIGLDITPSAEWGLNGRVQLGVELGPEGDVTIQRFEIRTRVLQFYTRRYSDVWYHYSCERVPGCPSTPTIDSRKQLPITTAWTKDGDEFEQIDEFEAGAPYDVPVWFPKGYRSPPAPNAWD